MAKYLMVTATIAHANELAQRVRQADRDEFAAYNMTPWEVLDEGLRMSTLAWAGLRDGRVVCIFGVATPSLLSGKGVPWMVGSDELDRCAYAFLLRSKIVVAHMLGLYEHLENYVDSRNTRAIRWLRWLGFQIHEPEPHGPHGVPFHRFEMRRSHV